MNCKTGDLAVIVRQPLTPYPLMGLIVRCKEPSIHPLNGTVGWRLYDALPTGDECIADFLLRPIRDTPGEDETLQWAPVPGQPVTA